MKIKMLLSTLAGLLLVTSAIAAGSCLWYVWSCRQDVAASLELERVNLRGKAVQALLRDSVEYSKHNPAIVPLLQNLNVLPRTGAGTPTPPPKTSSK
jgi:hypothetical protein